MEGDSKLLIWPSQSPNFGPSASDDTLIRWTERGITAICTLVEGKTFKNFEKLKREFRLENRDLYHDLQLRHFYDKEVKRYLSAEINEMIVFLTDAHKRTPSRTVSKLYSSLQNVMKEIHYMSNQNGNKNSMSYCQRVIGFPCATHNNLQLAREGGENSDGKISFTFLSPQRLNNYNNNRNVGGGVDMWMPITLISFGHV